MTTRIFFLLLASSLFLSCASRSKLAYYQDISKLPESETSYQPVLKSDDLLFIVVSSTVPEAAAEFNLAAFGIMSNLSSGNPETANSQLRHYTYLIDNQGYIEFPTLGKLKLGGLTREAALELLKSELKKYIRDPLINLRILNYKITVQGEVARPGTFNLVTERITLPEALTMAGDMTIYGKRDNVLIIREIDGKRTYNFVDITKSDFINSPFYYLSQNDLVYVEPNKTKMNSSVVGPNISIALSALSLLITVVALLIR